MAQYGLEVKINNKLLCRAGFEKDYNVLSCIVDSMFRKQDEEATLNIRVGGLNTSRHEHVEWYKDILQKGDEINIKIITHGFEKPSKVYKQDSDEFILEKKIEYYHRLKEELKDYI